MVLDLKFIYGKSGMKVGYHAPFFNQGDSWSQCLKNVCTGQYLYKYLASDLVQCEKSGIYSLSLKMHLFSYIIKWA